MCFSNVNSPGRPTVSSTITIVINPAWGIPAAPIEAAVAVTLHVEGFLKKGLFLKKKKA